MNEHEHKHLFNATMHKFWDGYYKRIMWANIHLYGVRFKHRAEARSLWRENERAYRYRLGKFELKKEE